MNHRQIFVGFCDLLINENFDSQAIQDLPQLSQTLKKLEKDQSDDAMADAILDWCANHQPLGENLRFGALRWDSDSTNEAEEEQIKRNISKPKIQQQIEETIAQKPEISKVNKNIS